MSGLSDKETGSEFSGVEILPNRNCLRGFLVILFLGRREIPCCSYAFIEGVFAGVIGVPLKIESLISLSHSFSNSLWPMRRSNRSIE